MTSAHSVLVHGVSVPRFFYGTAWKEHRSAELTSAALAAGFRAIDTANQRRHYVEDAVGQAVQASIDKGIVSRDELFLQTKFTHLAGQDHRLPYDPAADTATRVTQSFESSLAHLGCSVLDSYVLHGPSTAYGLGREDWDAWGAMEGLQRSGRVRLLGISNVSLSQLSRLCRDVTIRPAFVQNRCFARAGWDHDVRELCRELGIAYQGFSLLTANQRQITHPGVVRVAQHIGKPLTSVVFRFALQLGIIPLTGTTSVEHMKQALECLEFELDDDAVQAVWKHTTS